MNDNKVKVTTVRFPSDVHEFTVKEAVHDGRSFNSYLVSLVRKEMRNADARKTDMASWL